MTGQLGNCANNKLELFVDEFVSFYSDLLWLDYYCDVYSRAG